VINYTPKQKQQTIRTCFGDAVNILIVDDEPAVLEILNEDIQESFEGCKVYQALNGEQAVGLESNIDFDAIVTDYKMPIMDGFKFAEYTRNEGRNKTTPIIFLSGFMPELKKLDSTFDQVFFLEKPQDMVKVVKYIKMFKKKAAKEA
jgi:CheY-like chemotaxis protein